MDGLASLVDGLDASFWDAVPSPVKPPPLDIAQFLAGAEDWDLDEDPFTPQKPKAAAPEIPAAPVSDPLTRCIVDVVEETELSGRWSKVLRVHLDKSDHDHRTVYLQDDWYETRVQSGDVVNVLGNWLPSIPAPQITISSQYNMLILHPDILLTATALSNAPQCRRKPMLSSLVRASNDTSPALVWGNMLHEVMQRCLLQDRWDEAWIYKQIDEVILDGLGSLLTLEITEETARATMRDRVRGLPGFRERYIGETPKPAATLSDTRASNSTKPTLLAISRIHEIEEDIWSPKYGLKGKLDVTVEAVVAQGNSYSQPAPPKRNGFVSRASASTSRAGQATLPGMLTIPQAPSTSGPRPFEIKTGRSIGGMEHRAQTMLYTLLTSERYGVEVDKGLLYYTQNDSGEIVQVPRGRNEIRGLMVMRNELASWMMTRIRKHSTSRIADQNMNLEIDSTKGETPCSTDVEEPFLPAPIDSDHACKRCYVLDTCTLYRFALATPSPTYKPVESPPPADTTLNQTFQTKTEHLTPAHAEFFRKWERLLALEEKDLVRFKSELWRVGAQEREKRGRCFAGMVMKTSHNDEPIAEKEKTDMGGTRIHKFTYTFVRSKQFGTSQEANGLSQSGPPNLLNGHLSIGDAITLSVEPHLLALVQGYILDLSPDEVKVGVDHSVDIPTIKERLRILKRRNGDQENHSEEVIFRIDKDELFGGMSRMRNNLAQLFYVDGDHKRRELIVDLRKPIFATPSNSTFQPTLDNKEAADLNESQQHAIRKVLSAEDYALILGMPGTGKTTVVAALIRVLVSKGKTVLLASYTHSAVDSILRKLDQGKTGEWDDKVLRLGNVDKVHPDARRYTLRARRKAITIQQLEQQWMSPPIIASTCLGVDHALFAKRRFDYCIVDEASQITLPTCLGPLRFADRFVLVGDHFQLPPLVKNPEARQGGLDVSLFRRLSDAHPQSVVDLNQQYRMNKEIMLLSNKLIYDDRLRCGTKLVAERALDLPNKGALHVIHRELKRHGQAQSCEKRNCWVEHLANPRTKAVFVDTDPLGKVAYDSRAGDLVQNVVEADLVVEFVETLVRCGIDQSQIGIISLYRQQVKLLTHKLIVENDRNLGGVEVLTADKSQGRDKDCIVVSLVRSNADNQIGELVKDWRRMNVSFTRARSKLVIFGSRSTLKGDPLLSQFFELMDGQGWVYPLPKDAHLVHCTGPWDSDSSDKVQDEEAQDSAEEPPESDDIIIVDSAPQQPRKTSPLKRPAEAMEESDKVKSRQEYIVIDDDDDDMAEEPSHKPMDIDIDDDDDVIIVSSGPTSQATSSTSSSSKSSTSLSTHAVKGKGKNKENRSVISVSSSSSQTSSSRSQQSIQSAPRTNQSKLDGWFKKATPGANKQVKSQTPEKPQEERPKKILKVKDDSDTVKKNGGTRALTKPMERGKKQANSKKVKGLLNGRPILQDLVKNEV